MRRQSLCMYNSRICVGNRCVISTPARKGRATVKHVPWTALDVFLSLYVFSNLPVSGIKGQTETPLSPKPQNSPSGVNSNHQRATSTHVYDRFPLIRMKPMNKSDVLFGGKGNVKSARPTKHTKFKSNKLTRAAN